MTIKDIDLYRLRAEDLAKYLPEGGCSGARSADELAQMLIGGERKAAECDGIDRRMAEAVDGVLGVDLRLPESDPMQQMVPEKIIELNSPDAGSPIIVTGNSIITHQVLGRVLNAARTRAFVIPVDTMGLTYDNAVAGGFFTPMKVMTALAESGIASRSSARRMVIGGLGSSIRSGIERVTRWTVDLGPVSGYELPLWLLSRQ